MELVSNRTFHEETVLLDGKHFVNCNLEACELTYGGGAVSFERTLISGCDCAFGGQAGRTVDLLKVVGILGETFSTRIDAQEPVN